MFSRIMNIASLGAVRDQSTAARSEWESQLEERRQELEAAMRMVEGSARSMGIKVVG